jgi:hypothetical protein
LLAPPNGFKGLKSLYFEKLDVLIGKLPFPDGAAGANGFDKFIPLPPPPTLDLGGAEKSVFYF